MSEQVTISRQEYDQWQSSLKALQTQVDSLKKQQSISVPWLPILVLISLVFVLVIGVGALVYFDKEITTEVTVEYNIGEILGGLGIGAGATAAGVAYAFRSLRAHEATQEESQ
jgi:hypothetical protein